MAEITNDSALPELRAELQFKPGIRELDGSKSWLVFDPLRHEYFQLDGKNYQMLKNWTAGTAGDLVNRLEEGLITLCLLYTSPSPRDRTRSRMPSSA